MSHKTTTHWKGGMQFESDNPSGKTVLMDTVVKDQYKQFGLSPKAMMLSALVLFTIWRVVKKIDRTVKEKS